MQRLDWSLSRKVTQDIKTQPQINHYQSISKDPEFLIMKIREKREKISEKKSGFFGSVRSLTTFLSLTSPYSERSEWNGVGRSWVEEEGGQWEDDSERNLGNQPKDLSKMNLWEVSYL